MNEQLVIDFWGDISLALKQEIDSSIIENINFELDKSDYSVANLESPIINNALQLPIVKDGPNLCTNEETVKFYRELKFNCYTLANNHIGDYGVEGIDDTINTLESINKEYVGTSREIDKTFFPLRKVINGIKFSIFSFCENEFGVVTETKRGVAGYNPTVIKELVQAEKKISEYVFVVFHGGTEYYPFPSPKQKERYHGLVDWGADYILGMHSHCPQGYECYKGAGIFYGLGNFYFPLQTPTIHESWSYGYGVRIYLSHNKSRHEIIPHYMSQDGDDFIFLSSKKFLSYFNELSNYIMNDLDIQKLFRVWAKINGNRMLGKIATCIEEKTRKSEAIIRNYFICESHNEVLTSYSNFLYEGYGTDDDKYLEIIKKYRSIRSFLDADQVKEEKAIFSDEYKKDRYILWGVSDKTFSLISQCKSRGIIPLIVDEDILKQGMRFMEIVVGQPEEIMKKYPRAIWCVCTQECFYEEIRRTLVMCGIKEENITYNTLEFEQDM